MLHIQTRRRKRASKPNYRPFSNKEKNNVWALESKKLFATTLYRPMLLYELLAIPCKRCLAGPWPEISESETKRGGINSVSD